MCVFIYVRACVWVCGCIYEPAQHVVNQIGTLSGGADVRQHLPPYPPRRALARVPNTKP